MSKQQVKGRHEEAKGKKAVTGHVAGDEKLAEGKVQASVDRKAKIKKDNKAKKNS